MPSLFHRAGKNNWYVEYTLADGRRARKSSGTENKLNARRFANKLQEEQWNLKKGFVTPEQVEFRNQRQRPVSAHIAEYLTDCDRVRMSPKNVRSKEMVLGKFVQASKPATINGIQTHTVRAFLATVAGSARTKNLYRQQILAFLSWLVANNRLERNPIQVRPVKEERVAHRRALSVLEVRHLLEVVRASFPATAFFELAFFAGLRRGELQRARWEDVNLGSMVVTIRNHKGHRTDEVPLLPRVAAALSRVPHRSHLIFHDPPTNRQRQRFFTAAGIPLIDDLGRKADLHSARMTLQQLCKDTGVDPRTTSALLRHKDIKTTLDHYQDLSVLFRDESRALEGIAGLFEDDVSIGRVG